MRSIRRIATRTCALTLLLAACFGVAAQEIQPERVGLSSERLARVGELMQRNIDAGNFSGAVTLVARNGTIAHLEAHGLMDIESDTPMREDAFFRVASMTKPFTAAAILILVEEGQVNLDDRVAEFLPSFADQRVAVIEGSGQGPGGFGGPPPEYYTVPAERDITILDLLTHTSGFMSGRVGNAETQERYGQRHDLGLSWVEGMGSVPLDFQPGSRWAYSAGGGFDVLARIVEIASGRTFDEFLAGRIFEPLGVEGIFYWPTEAQRERLVKTYVGGPEGLQPRPNPDMMSGPEYFSGSGGLMSTTEAYGRFAMMLANGGELGGIRILSPAAVELMGSPFIAQDLPGFLQGATPDRRPGEGFGLGVRVVVDPVERHSMVSEGSFGWSGFYGSYFWADPGKNLAAVLMVQTFDRDAWYDFETAVMQAVVE